ncbi:hypothetical protein PR048_030669 [Dryococelus australis]|uniref:Uncharacterized protein n=1 Tax=Dryococelus australis TaxID=614101 RepID=A0ABQ9G9K8_9NEOP|nr:hypothetical protein PR048_030669 [Dryococelus australis]
MNNVAHNSAGCSHQRSATVSGEKKNRQWEWCNLWYRLFTVKTASNPRTGHSRIFAGRSRVARRRWSAGFLGISRLQPPFKPSTAPFSPHFTLIDSPHLGTTDGACRMKYYQHISACRTVAYQQASYFQAAEWLKTSTLPIFCFADNQPPAHCWGKNLYTSRMKRNYAVYGLYNISEAMNRGLESRWERREVRAEQRQNGRTGKTGDPRENPPTSDIIQHDSHMRKSGSDTARNRTRGACKSNTHKQNRSSTLLYTPTNYTGAKTSYAVVAEWLRRLTRNQIPSGSVAAQCKSGGNGISGTVPTREYPRATPLGIDPGSPRWEASGMTTTLHWPLPALTRFCTRRTKLAYLLPPGTHAQILTQSGMFGRGSDLRGGRQPAVTYEVSILYNARLHHRGSKLDPRSELRSTQKTVQSWTGDRGEVHFEPPKLAVRNLDPRSAVIITRGFPAGSCCICVRGRWSRNMTRLFITMNRDRLPTLSAPRYLSQKPLCCMAYAIQVATRNGLQRPPRQGLEKAAKDKALVPYRPAECTKGTEPEILRKKETCDSRCANTGTALVDFFHGANTRPTGRGIATCMLRGCRARNCNCGYRLFTQCRSEKAGETGDPRENPPTSGIVRHDSHLRESGVNRPGIEPGSHWWEASSLTAQSPCFPPPFRREEPYEKRSRYEETTKAGFTRCKMSANLTRDADLAREFLAQVCVQGASCTKLGDRAGLIFLVQGDASCDPIGPCLLVIEVSTEQCWNARAGETGAPREDPPTSCIVRHDPHMRKSGGRPRRESNPDRLSIDTSTVSQHPQMGHSGMRRRKTGRRATLKGRLRCQVVWRPTDSGGY